MSISKKEIKQLDSYFRCANYLSVGQLYLLDNPLLKEELKWSDVKKKIVVIGVQYQDKTLSILI